MIAFTKIPVLRKETLYFLHIILYEVFLVFQKLWSLLPVAFNY